MSYDLNVPETLRELGRALQPLRQRLRFELATQVVATTVLADPMATLERHLDALPQRIQLLAVRVRDLNDDVAANPQASAADVQRAVARLAAAVDDLVAGLRNARTLRSDGSAAEMPWLLVGMYHHVLGEVVSWLERIVSVLADPAAEAARQHLPTDRPIEFSFALQMTAAPQLEGLHQWIRRQQSTCALSPPRALSLMDKVSAVVLGLAFGGDGWPAASTVRHTGLPLSRSPSPCPRPRNFAPPCPARARSSSRATCASGSGSSRVPCCVSCSKPTACACWAPRATCAA